MLVADGTNVIAGKLFVRSNHYVATMPAVWCSMVSNILCECVIACRKLFYKILLKWVDL